MLFWDLRHIPAEGGGCLLNVGGLFCRSFLRDIGLFGVILGSASHSGGKRPDSFCVGLFCVVQVSFAWSGLFCVV